MNVGFPIRLVPPIQPVPPRHVIEVERGPGCWFMTILRDDQEVHRFIGNTLQEVGDHMAVLLTHPAGKLLGADIRLRLPGLAHDWWLLLQELPDEYSSTRIYVRERTAELLAPFGLDPSDTLELLHGGARDDTPQVGERVPTLPYPRGVAISSRPAP